MHGYTNRNRVFNNKERGYNNNVREYMKERNVKTRRADLPIQKMD